jgi:hypothetical protein
VRSAETGIHLRRPCAWRRRGDRQLNRRFCILSWRIFRMTMMNRVAPTAPPGIALTTVETHVLDLLLQDRPGSQSRPAALSSYLTKIARLGATLHAPRTLRPETPSCGAVCPGSRTSNSVSLSGRSLGVIESDTVRLPRASPGPPHLTQMPRPARGVARSAGRAWPWPRSLDLFHATIRNRDRISSPNHWI